MRLFAVLALAVAAASAQCASQAAAVPACGKTCIDTEAAKFGVAMDDYKSLCAKTADINPGAKACIAASAGCDAAAVQAAVGAVCACAA